MFEIDCFNQFIKSYIDHFTLLFIICSINRFDEYSVGSNTFHLHETWNATLTMESSHLNGWLRMKDINLLNPCAKKGDLKWVQIRVEQKCCSILPRYFISNTLFAYRGVSLWWKIKKFSFVFLHPTYSRVYEINGL